jgi:hypothetical protein
MREYKYCKICEDFHYGDSHFPEHNVYFEDEPTVIRASDHESAAEKFAVEYNVNNDYCLMNDSIEVKVDFKGDIKYFNVSA